MLLLIRRLMILVDRKSKIESPANETILNGAKDLVKALEVSPRDGAVKRFSRNGLNARCLSLMVPIQAFNLSFDGLDHLIST